MKSPSSSALTRSLLASARQDGPSASSKARIWNQVALAPQLSLVAASSAGKSIPPAAAAAATPAAAVGGLASTALLAGASAGKLLVAGAFAGSVMTLGLGMFLLRGAELRRVTASAVARPSDRPVSGPRIARFANAAGDVSANSPVQPPLLSSAVAPVEGSTAPATPPGATPSSADSPFPRPVVAPLVGPATRPTHARSATSDSPARGTVVGDDVLTREVSLVSEARTELRQGRPGAALELLDAATRGGSHSLEPEQLSLRARALRALGREDEAGRVEDTLKARFPEHFLAH